MTATDLPDLRELTYDERLDALREAKQEQTRDKQQYGPMDWDDKGLILPPPELRELVDTISSSGVAFTDVLLKGFHPKGNYPSGAFFGPKLHGENFRALLERHPTHIDPMSSLAGAYMVRYMSYRVPAPYRDPFWNPDFDYSHLFEEQDRYQIVSGIGGPQHFCQDMTVGLDLGWGGILQKIRHFRRVNAPRADDFYEALEDVVLGIQDFIRRHAEAARILAVTGQHLQLRANLEEMAVINERLVADPPRTFREACQWILWYQIVACMYNGSGSLGRLDMLLLPYYERERRAGLLTDDEAIFHIACLLLRETSYIQCGGPNVDGSDATNPVSFLVLEAAHRLKVPTNVGICVGRNTDPRLLQRGVEIILEEQLGMPKFLGIDNTVAGFAANGYPLELARQRAYSGCHWSALPGREYTLNDCTKINLPAVFEVALQEMAARRDPQPSVQALWAHFEQHLRRSVEVTAEGLDFHLEHMHEVFPELVLDLLCHGPIEKGLDASHGGVEFYNLCVDGAGLATVADSFAALEQRIEQEGRLTWDELMRYLASDWAGPDGERARLMMASIPHFGSGGSRADAYAQQIAELFAGAVKEKPTPAGYNMLPGLFGWAFIISMGKHVGATPNGRHSGAPISHGANPDRGFRRDGAPTALAIAVAQVQQPWGNASPLQLDVDPGFSRDERGREAIAGLIKTHFDLGGTQINLNVVDAQQILAAHNDPSLYPDLVVRVTGFSAYFASLSPELRQLVVDRIVTGG